MRIHRMFSVSLILLLAACTSWAATIHVPGDQPTIQAAIDAASQYDTVLIAAGVYDEPLNIDTRADLVIAGTDAATTIVKASTTLPWDIAPYGSSRQAMVRIVTSTNITLRNLTLDCDLIKGNNIMGILFWDATGSVENSILQNMSVADASGGYYEITAYVRAVSYTDMARADVSFTGNTFIDPGRVGIVAHGFVDINVAQNTFYKTTSDFGYAMEIGSQSIGSVSANTIHGYNTPAASDGSNSAGIYIENAYTAGTVGLTKSVSVSDNEVYDCQWAFYAGNEFDGYAGDVDMQLTVTGNNFHDNLDGAVIVTDEDRENGSSVNANFENNMLTDNGAYGYFIFSRGDGDITATLEGDFVNGQDTGIYLADYATTVSASSYQLTASGCDLSGNTAYGVANDYAAVTVDASGNWWGSSDPSVMAGLVTGEVDYTPWLASGSDSDPGSVGFQADLSSVWVDDDSPQSGTVGRISEGIDLVSGSTVNVAPGTYEEQIRIDAKSVDVVGAGIGNSIIEAVPVANRTTYSVTQWNGSARTIDACIGVTGPATVNISGFTIDGKRLGPDNFYGVHFFDADGSVVDCRVEDIVYDGNLSASRVTSLAATHSSGHTSTIEFSGNVIPNFQKIAILTMGPGINCTINNNTITGAINPSLAPNGMQISYGSSGTLSGNTVTGVEYPGTDWAGTGILLMESGDITVTGGAVIGCEVGISHVQWNWVYTPAVTPVVVFDGVDLLYNQWAAETHLGASGATLDLEIKNCSILNSTYVGVELWGSNADPYYGLYDGWTNGTLDANIHDNTITDGQVGVEQYIELTTGNTVNCSINGNNLADNTAYGVYNDFPALADATGNWWGDPAGPVVSTARSAAGSIERSLPVPYNAAELPIPEEITATRPFANGAAAGANVTADVDYSPWWGANYVGDSHASAWIWHMNQSNNSTIEEAVGLVKAGDIIHVASGTYHNDIHLLAKSVTLMGAFAGVDPAGSTGRGSETILTRDDSYALWIQPQASGAVINGFKFGSSTAGSGRRIYLNDADDVTIEYNIIQNSTGHGIAVSGPSAGSPSADRAMISHNTIDNSAWEGIVNFGASDAVITANHVKNIDNFGILTSGSASISQNVVTQCKDGIRNDYPGTGVSDRTEITGNTVSYTKYAGINVTGTYSHVFNNTVHHCNYFGSDATGDWDYASIHLEASAASSTVEGNTVYDGINGIQTWANNTVISNNDIFDMGVTYDSIKYVSDRVYRNSAILIGSNWGTGDIDPSGVVIHHNKIHGNHHGLFYSEDLTRGVMAELNYWGDTTGPYNALQNTAGLGDPVSNSVDFDPWCNADFSRCDFSLGCCGKYTGGYTGNVDCDADGDRNLADITRLVDRIYISHKSLCCEENGNTNGDVDGDVDLADITRLIDHVYISYNETATCQ